MDFLTFFSVSASLLVIGLVGIALNNKNVLIILMCLELVLLALNFNFCICSCFLDDRMGQIFAVFVLTVAAAESSVGLAILIVYYRVIGSISINKFIIRKPFI